MSITDAVDRLANRLAADPPAIVLAVGLNPGEDPSLWVLQRDGEARRMDDYKAPDDASGTTPTAPEIGEFTDRDLHEAAEWLRLIHTGVRHRNLSPAKAVEFASERRQERLMAPMVRALEAAAIEHLPQCPHCLRRFKSKGGLTRHTNAKHPGR